LQYNFSKLLNSNSLVAQKFIENYTLNIDIYDDMLNAACTKYYTEIFNIFKAPFKKKELLELFLELAEYKISRNIPYAIISNEIYSLKNLLLTEVSDIDTNKDVIKFLNLFRSINDSIAHLYLSKYIDTLLASNKLRLASIIGLTEKDLISYYEAHLVWLSKLAQHVKTKDKNKFPELNEEICEFGVWLDNVAKEIINNDLTYTRIRDMHKNIHIFAKRIRNIIESDSYHVLITYLEKTEFLSLSIGTELSLLDNIIINKKISKDSLTGALNRQVLKNIFQNQYELALATNNPFVLAMCDLDLFKHVNDTYGHLAGDYVLKSFVDIVKKNTRKSDIILRYGGEEFIIILPAMTKDQGYVVLEKIRTALEQAVLEFNKQSIHITISIGAMAIKSEHLYRKKFIEKYIAIVDKKLYEAKEKGRNRMEMD